MSIPRIGFSTLLTGAYYTFVPAAALLTRLVFHDWPDGVDWSDHEFPASLNVADIACGTGALLMAVAAEAERRHTEAGGRNAPRLHKAMVEQALHGYDVQLSAVHFAATSLAMLNPDIQFDRINLYVMPLGADGDDASLGSLDFLGESQAAVQFALTDLTRSALRLLDGGELWVPGESTTGQIPLCPHAYPLSATCHCERSVAISSPEESSSSSARSLRRYAPRDDKLGTPEPLCLLAELGEVGPDRRDLWDRFERTDAVTTYPMVENRDTQQRTRLTTEPDKYLAPLVEPRPGATLSLWSNCGRKPAR